MYETCQSTINFINYTKTLLTFEQQMGAICVKNDGRTGSNQSISSSQFHTRSTVNSIQTKMDKGEYQRLQIIKQNLNSSNTSPDKQQKNQPQRQINDFKFIRHLGDGAYGQVLMVRDLKSSNHYAMKIIRKQLIIAREQILNTLSQRYILAAMDHPFVVKLHYAFQTKNKVYLIVDLMSGGELFYLLRRNKKFVEQTARFYAAEILLALEYLHSKKIIYRDLKPENVLLDKDGHVKLTDFGLSKVVLKKNQVATSVCGTPEYIAPEVLKGKGYTLAADWFSFGSLLYDMLTGKPPFYSKDKEDMMQKIQTKQIPFPDYISPAAKSLLKSLFEKKESNRIGFKTDASEIKNHEFFKSINFDDIYHKRTKAPFSFEDNINSQGFVVKIDEYEVQQSYEKELVQQSKGVNFEGFTYQVKGKCAQSKGSNDIGSPQNEGEKFNDEAEIDVDLEMKISDAMDADNQESPVATDDINDNHNQTLESIENSSEQKPSKSTFSMSIYEMQKKNTPQKKDELKPLDLQPIKEMGRLSFNYNINETLYQDEMQSPKLALSPTPHGSPQKRELSFRHKQDFVVATVMEEIRI